MLLTFSMIIGITSVALINHNLINTNFSYIVVNGATTGILAIMLPSLLTILIVKSVRDMSNVKYIFFITIISTICYSMFLLLASIIYILTHAYAISPQ